MNKDVSRKIKTALWLGWKEFAFVFSCRSCANSWDFTRFILLISLSMLLALFAVGTKHGLLDNQAKVLLGNLPGAGIPIWLSPNIGVGVSKLKQKELDQLTDNNLEFHPFLDVAAIKLRLAGCHFDENTEAEGSKACSLWHDKNPRSRKNRNIVKPSPLFKVVSVFSDDPLWKYAVKSDTSIMQLVLDKKLFEEFFDFKAYISEISERLPTSLVENLPSKEEFFDINYKGSLWISFGKKASERQLLEFKINWVEHIPMSGNIAMLFPLEIYQSLILSNKKDKNPDEKGVIAKNYYPESYQKARISSVEVTWDDLGGQNLENSKDKFLQLKTCLQNINTTSLDTWGKKTADLENEVISKATVNLQQISLLPPKPYQWVESCIKDIAMKPCSEEVSFKCVAMIPVDDSKVRFKYKKTKEDGYLFFVKKDENKTKQYLLFDYIGYNKGIVYVENASKLIEAKDYIDNLEGKPFHFNPRYEDSLIRFNALNDILQKISSTYGVWIAVFISILLGIQLAVMINHRKPEYQIYIWKGLEIRYVFILVVFQMLLSIIAALVISSIFIYLTHEIISNAMTSIVSHYNTIFFNKTIDILKIYKSDYLYVFIKILLITVVCVILWLALIHKSISMWGGSIVSLLIGRKKV